MRNPLNITADKKAHRDSNCGGRSGFSGGSEVETFIEEDSGRTPDLLELLSQQGIFTYAHIFRFTNVIVCDFPLSEDDLSPKTQTTLIHR